jgi:hypothetical protein
MWINYKSARFVGPHHITPPTSLAHGKKPLDGSIRFMDAGYAEWQI